MKLLKDRILKDGIVKPGNILKVDSFLNHQMDITLINEIGKEFKRSKHPVLESHVLLHSILMCLLSSQKKHRV